MEYKHIMDIVVNYILVQEQQYHKGKLLLQLVQQEIQQVHIYILK